MRILVVGAGSTGGYFGARLAQAGRDVTFLVRPARAAHLRANGLQIVSPNGDLTITPKLLDAAAITAPFDAVLLTVKGFSLEAALADIAPAVGPDTMVLPFLNGMKHVDMIGARFGQAAVVGCVVKIATTIDGQGRILQLAKLHDMAYGEMDGATTERITHFDAAMQGSGFDARLTPHIRREMWEKWIMLATLGGMNCLMRGTVGEIAAAPGGTAFARALLDEVIAVVRAAGSPPSEPFLVAINTMVTQAGSPQTTSMYRDLVGGLPIEADQIVGDLLVRAQAAEVATPLLAAAFTNLSVYQAKIAG